jgi:hypothetical protein
MTPKQVVVARYNEDVQWVGGLPAIIYNKGPQLVSSAPVRELPNVGREAQTYLQHITGCWNELADMTVFCQGQVNDHLPPDVRIENLLAGPMDIAVANLISMREWGPDGRIQFIPGIHKRQLDSGEMKRAELSLVDYFRTYLNLNLLGLGSTVFAPGAIFAVRRQCIHRRPREFYYRLLATVDHHVNPEEGHYLERSWMYIFGVGISQIACLSKHPPKLTPKL